MQNKKFRFRPTVALVIEGEGEVRRRWVTRDDPTRTAQLSQIDFEGEIGLV